MNMGHRTNGSRAISRFRHGKGENLKSKNVKMHGLLFLA